MREDILITVVTVCYNAEKYIEQTLQSVKNQTYRNYEYIIVDGKSNDRTLQIIDKYKNDFWRLNVFSEKDTGIYNAMNKGIDLAKGKYLIFMNAGDSFYSNDVLEKISKVLVGKDYDIVYGKTMVVNETQTWTNKEKMNMWLLLRGATICHQAVLAKTERLKSRKFKEKYTLCADREWLYWAYKKGLKYKYVNFYICKFDNNGISSNKNKRDAEREEILALFYPTISKFRKLLLKLKKNGDISNEKKQSFNIK